MQYTQRKYNETPIFDNKQTNLALVILTFVYITPSNYTTLFI